MTLSFTTLVYIVITLVFLKVTYTAVAKEIKARPDFEMTGLGGTTNVYRYYRHLRQNNEKPGPMLKLLLLAYINLVICMIVVATGVLGGK
jgi:hypothetical protein